MTLSALIRKRNIDTLATAMPAIAATQPKVSEATVAGIATVAVANPKEGQNVAPTNVSSNATATASSGWLIHYPDRDPQEVTCYPEATHGEIMENYPDATAAESFIRPIRHASASLTASEEAAIRAWLALIEETDPTTIAEVIVQCQQNADARDYFAGRAAAELPNPDQIHDDWRTCRQLRKGNHLQ